MDIYNHICGKTLVDGLYNDIFIQISLPHGVMLAQKILVLLDMVQVRVRQQKSLNSYHS